VSHDTTFKLPDPLGFGSDPFTDVLRDGVRKLIDQPGGLLSTRVRFTGSG